MKIYNPAGIEMLDIQVDDSSVRYRSIMNDDSLTLNFSTTGPVSIPRGSYVDFEGARYTLFYPENFKKNSTRDFAYTLTLHGYREALKLYKYKDLSSKPYRLKFVLTARPEDFLQLLVDNMNNSDAAGGWVAGDCIEADEKTISYNHEYCFDVLNRVAEEFNTEWEIAGKTVHLRKVEKFKDTPLVLSYGMGNGFKTGVGRSNDGDKQPIGRLYVQGGERNIDYTEYGSTSLLLPKSATLVFEGKTYRTDEDGMYITRDGNTKPAEDSHDGSSHYPKRVGTVSHVIEVDAEKHFYDIRDTSIPETLNFRDCRIPGEKATIVFQSGPLAGREFDIEQTEDDLTGYMHVERRFKIVPAELDGQIMPGGVFVPRVGDKYAIFNISMPPAYISDNATKTGASWDMFREAVRYFADEENDKFIFTGELDGIWSRSKWLEIGGKIVPGGHVLFSDPQFQPDGIVIRITAVKDHVNTPHKPEITLSNAPVSGSFAADLGKIEAEPVVREADKKDVIRFTKRQYQDAKETMSLLQQSLLNYSGSINPITVQTMQLLVGDESLQFRFVGSKTNPEPVSHTIDYNAATSVLTASTGIIQHMTLGITSLKKAHAANEYKYWDMEAYVSPALDPEKAYYLYARCQKSGTAGMFLLSETGIGMEGVANYYHFLVAIINSEQDGDRSIAPLYGFTEILPGRVTTDTIVSQDGKTYFDLLNGIIGGRIKFLSNNAETDLEVWADDVASDIQDTQQAASQADQKAQQAIGDVAASVDDYNAKFAAQQAQIDGEISNWFYPYSPTLSNYPASDWVTNEEKDRHIGDTFTNTAQHPATDAGKSWRFVKNGSVYSWTQIADSDAVLALQKAAQAQSTADGKSTTFLVQPSNYHLGDTWVLNSNRTVNGIAYKQGDILNSTNDSEVFVESHWIKRVRYTDDTTADAAQQAANNAQSAADAAQTAINDLDDYVDGAFKDGVIEEAEAKAIEKYLNSLSETKLSVDSAYTQVYNNSYLEGTPKTNLASAKTALNTAYTNLVNSINTAIAGGATTPAEKADVDAKFGLFNTAMATYQTRLEEANKAIQNTIKGFADDAMAKASQADYLREALQQSTEIEGGLILGSVIGARNSSGQVKSYQNGDPELNNTAFAAGVHGFGTEDETRTVSLNHDGSADVGVLRVTQEGKVVLVDPATNEERLLFLEQDIPTAADLLSSTTDGGNRSNSARQGAVTFTLPNTMPVTKGNSKITVVAAEVKISGSTGTGNPGTGGPVPQDGLRVEVNLLRNGVHYALIGSRSLHFQNSMQYLEDTFSIDREFAGCPVGTYSIRVSVLPSGDIVSKLASISASTMSWQFNQDVNYFQFGLNGFMAWFLNNAAHFDKDNGWMVKGKSDTPGVLLSATVASTGGWSDVWGAKQSSTNPVRNSTGRYTVYHTIGHAKYQVSCGAYTENRSWKIVSKSANNVVIEWRTIGSSPALIDTVFDITLTGNNYSS
mgnify:FL=1